MSNESHRIRDGVLRLGMTNFWSGDLGLTLISISLVFLVFVVVPTREAGIPGRIFFDSAIFVLMALAALAAKQSRLETSFMIAMVLSTAIFLVYGRLHPTLLNRLIGSALTTLTLLLYVRIVLLVMFRAGAITWSRIQGAVSAYLLIGLAWGSAYEFLEGLQPGSFHFITQPGDVDQLAAKLTYYSFSTLTTVGFGDITPLLPFSRSLSVAEAIVGQLFPAILVGALVAMAMQSRSKS
jgi:hypothetical protein